MIDADLAIVDAAELVTVPGPAPKVGDRLGEIGVVERGCVAARDGVIVFVGDERDYRRQVRLSRHGLEIDATGRTVLPGFVDCHTHLPFAGWRETEFVARLRGETYESIAARGGGILSTVRSTRAASIDALVEAGKERLNRMLLHGTTTAEAKSGYGLTLEDELKQLRAVQRLHDIHPVDLVPTFLGAHVVPEERRGDRGGYVREVSERMIPEVAREGLARFCDVFIDEGAFTPPEAETVLRAAAAHGLGLRVHAEQRRATGGAILAARLGAASADHLDHLTDEGMAALRDAGTTAVLLPGASFFLRDARDAPARRLIEAGVPVALATDFNPGTCPTEALTAILPLACLRLGMEPAEAIAAATLNAARSLGIDTRCGSLEVGKTADLQILDVPNHLHLAYHFGVNHCRLVVKQGRVVVEAGVITQGGSRPAGPGEAVV
ncbi:MAG TPA: imidazolonepropionase [Candidatus Polarisedimenticolia bacterium]|nr:imidazolonepropionase [Candidatus Polarisedimenticolia bacterium]